MGRLPERKQKLEKPLKAFVLILTISLPLILSSFLYSNYQTTASSFDALSHLYIAKNVIHNGEKSGIRNLGTVWLPLYHICLLPFVFFNQLYFSGFAGTILGVALLFFSTLIIFRFLSFPENIFSAFLFISHPYLLISAISPMTEILAIFLFLFTAYQFHRFLERGKGIVPLIIGVILGTLTRYEFYPIPFLLLPFLISRLRKTGSWLRLLIFSFLPFLGIVFWFFWNHLLFSDPMFFFHHPVTEGTVGRLPYSYSWRKVLSLNFALLKELFGIIPFFSLFGIFLLIGKKRVDLLFPFLFLIVPSLTHLLLAYHNISLLYARFFLLSFSGLILLAFIPIKEIFSKKPIFSYLFPLVILFLYLPTLIANYSIIRTGKNHYGDKIPIPDLDIDYPKVSNHLKIPQNFFSDMEISSARILIPFNQEFQSISFALHLTPERIFDPYDDDLILRIMEKPQDFCNFLLLPTEPTPFCIRFREYYKGKYFVLSFWEDAKYHRMVLTNFSLVKESKGLRLYKKKRYLLSLSRSALLCPEG
uniref:Glycosyltransferase RgtA/B/C/D-like domain-containing protein n=1 Tax=candidate division WOR-3 bacterium TaxID=2052148 RepID=A0A7C3UQG2_UNCW3